MMSQKPLSDSSYIKPTSPLDIIPIPSLIALLLSHLKNNIAGSLHPTNFVIMNLLLLLFQQDIIYMKINASKVI